MNLRLVDRSVLIAGFLLLFSAGTLLVTGYPVRKLLFPNVFQNDSDPVGHLVSSQGALRRKTLGTSEFEAIQDRAVLFNHDTLVTGPEAGAVFEFDDGTQITLEERTMVIVEKPFSVSGFGNSLVISLLKGRVTAKPKQVTLQIHSADKVTWVAPKTETTLSDRLEPTPPPPIATPKPSVVAAPPPAPATPRLAPIRAEILSPAEKTVLSLPPQASVLEVRTLLSWRLSRAAPVRVLVDFKGRTVFEKSVSEPKVAAQVELRLGVPGTYDMTLEDLQTHKALATRRFEFSPVIESLTLNPPLVAGQHMANNAFMGALQKDFKVDFSWSGPPAVTNFRLDFFHQPTDKKAGLSFPVKGNRFALKRSQAINGTFYYQVVGNKGPFVLVSKRAPFRFDFLPPLPTVPIDGATLKGQTGGTEVLFTWQKTNFTESYRFELSRTPDFSKPIYKKDLKENFLIIRRVTPGTFYWRVQGIAGKVTSVPSQSHRLVLSNP